MPPALTNYTFAFGDNGTILNTDSISLPFVDVTSVAGLDLAPIRSTTTERHNSDGAHVDAKFLSMRVVVIIGTLYSDPNDPDTFLNSLKGAYGNPNVQPFYFQTPGQPLKFVNGQGGGCLYEYDQNRRHGATPVQLTVLAGDPYIYDWPAQVGTTIVGTGAGIGTGFNMAFNTGFGGTIVTAGATVGNIGSHTAYPVVTLQGPLTNPVLVDAFGITMAFNITLAANDSLAVDCRNKSVILNGQASRRSSLAGLNWFSVPAGTSETIFLSADSGTGSATITMNSTYY
jgi:hypothetical protein